MEKQYDMDSYLRSSTAQVLRCTPVRNGWEILLDRTIFYPTGGGQPCDFGTLGGANVLDVSMRDGEIIHLCDAPSEPGSTVACDIDWARRFDFMQQHSGEHLVSGIIHARFGYENVGFHMGSKLITIDFSGEITPQQLIEVEQAANEAVWANIPSTIWYPSAQELASLPYRSKKALTGAVRLVRFGEVDLCACCGTHVRATGEIGIIKLLSCVRFHSGSRIEMVCGGRALRYLNAVFSQNREISGLLSAKPLETAEAVRRLSAEAEQRKYQLSQTEKDLFSLRAEHFAAAGDVLLFEPAMQADSLRRLTDGIAQRCGGCCAVFAGEDGSYKYAICRPGGDLRALVRELNAALCGRGGGKPEFVQGSAAASRSQIEAFFYSCFGKSILQ